MSDDIQIVRDRLEVEIWELLEAILARAQQDDLKLDHRFLAIARTQFDLGFLVLDRALKR